MALISTDAPFNLKDWSVVLPVSLLAVGFLVVIGVWAAKQLGIVKKNGDPHPAIPPVPLSIQSGSLDPAFWKQEFREAIGKICAFLVLTTCLAYPNVQIDAAFVTPIAN